MAAIEGKWYASVGSHARSSYPEDDDTVRWVYANQPNGERYVVAKVWAGDDGDFKSTAQLVAAAPEMLSVLRTALNELVCLYEEVYPDDESDNDTTAAIDAITDVIAKAERSA